MELTLIGAEAVGLLRALRDLRKLPATQLPRADDIIRRFEAATAPAPDQLVLL
jgi:hypothetical protein